MMTENTIGSFFTKMSNEVEKQMDEDLKNFGITANELEVLIELRYHKHGKKLEKLAKAIHVNDEKLKTLTTPLATKKLITILMIQLWIQMKEKSFARR